MNNIKNFLDNKHFTVLFSGGKDSLASLLWVLDNIHHSNWNVLYIEMTGNTDKRNIDYVYEIIGRLKILDRLIHVKLPFDFFEKVREWGIPVFKYYRWCMKNKAILIGKYASKITVSGFKKVDSIRRREYNAIEFMRLSRTLSINPILNWSNRDVIKFISNHNLRLNPCYSLFGHEGNCMFCPMHSKTQIIRTMNDPTWREKILDTLLQNKEREKRGYISNSIIERWLKYSKQTVLVP